MDVVAKGFLSARLFSVIYLRFIGVCPSNSGQMGIGDKI